MAVRYDIAYNQSTAESLSPDVDNLIIFAESPALTFIFSQRFSPDNKCQVSRGRLLKGKVSAY